MKHSLKEIVNKETKSIQLSSEQLQTLDTLQLATAKQRPSNQKWSSMVGIAAMLLLTVLFLQERFLGSSGTMINEIAMEVVKNHLHQKPLEVNASQLASIRSYFTRLDFVPVQSEFMQSKNLSLLGGRYCSLQGITAAQLRFKSVNIDGVHTLYQVGYDPDIFKTLPDVDNGESPVIVYDSGVKVTLWVEKNVLFALTEN